MKQWRSIIDLRYTIPFLVVAGVISFALTRWTSLTGRLGFWWVFLIVVAALLLVGLIAAWEDGQPGGLDNPNDKDPT